MINGRNAEKLATAQTEVEAVAKGKVVAVQADVTTGAGRAALIAACPEPDILLNNIAGPKPKRFLDTQREGSV